MSPGLANHPLEVWVARVPNLFRPTERTVTREPWRPGLVLRDLVPEEWTDAAWALHRNEKVPQMLWSRQEVRPGDAVVLVADPHFTAAFFVGLGVKSVLLASVIAFVVNLALSYGLSQLAAKLTAPPEDSDFGGSPTYGWGSIQMTTRNGQPIPVQYGKHRVAGQVLQVRPTQDEKGDVYLKMLLGLGEGPVQSIGGISIDTDLVKSEDLDADIYVGGNRVSELRGLQYALRLGSLYQNAIPGFSELVTPVDVGVALEQNVAVAQDTTTEVDAFELVFLHPEGIYWRTKKGDVHHGPIHYQVRWRIKDTDEWIFTEEIETQAERTSPFTTVYRTDTPREILGGATFLEIEVTKLSGPSDERRKKAITWQQTLELDTSVSLAYPHTALLAVVIPASSGLTGEGLPNVTAEVEGRITWQWDPDDLDPETTDLTYAYSTNPAHATFDWLLNPRYGGGDIFSLCDIDLESFDVWRLYCDELVDDLSGTATTAKRWEVGLVIDSVQGLWQNAQRIAALGRAQLMLDGRKVRIHVEKASDPAQLFTMGNIERDSFSMQYASLEDRANYVEVQFLDAARAYEHGVAALEDRERVTDPSVTLRKETVQLYGLTAKWRAYRAAQYLLNLARTMLISVEFKAGIDAVAVEPGDVFQFQHDLPDWDTTFGGRLYGNSGSTTVILDREITIAENDAWKVWVRTSGTGVDVVQEAFIIEAAGTYAEGETLAVGSAWTGGDLPLRGDVYAAVQTLGTSTIQEFRVVEAELQQDLKKRISAVQYDADVYDDTPALELDDDLDPDYDSNLLPPNPTNLSLFEVGSGSNPGVLVSWTPAEWPLPQTFKVWFRNQTLEEVAWSEAGVTRGTTWTVWGLELSNEYFFSVCPIKGEGFERHPDQGLIGSIYLEGPDLFPDDVTGLTVTQSGTYVSLAWTGVDLLEDNVQSYIVWTGRSWQNRTVIAELTGTSHVTQKWSVGTEYFGVRVLAFGGYYSLKPPVTSATLTIPSHESTDNTYDEVALTWPGTKTNVTVNADGYLELSASQATGTYTSASRDEGSNASRRLSLNVQTEQFDEAFTWDEADFFWSDLTTETWADMTQTWAHLAPTWESKAMKERLWSGDVATDASSVTVYYAVDPGAGYGDWIPYSPQVETSFRYHKFKLEFLRDSVTDRQVQVDACLTTVSS